MLSRVAESIYWMARYIERAENVARFVEVNLNLSLDMPTGSEQQWLPLVTTSGDQEAFVEQYGEATQANVLRFLTFDPENANSIQACVRAARENARSIRECISADMWEAINQFHLVVSAAAASRHALDSPQNFYHEVRQFSHLFAGLTDSTLSHGEAWHFSRLGRLLERADKTSRILDVKYYMLLPTVQDVGTPYDDIQWASLLRSASAFEMYRQRWGRIHPRAIVEFLVLDKHFPRAVLFCLTKSNDSLHAISGVPSGTFSNAAEQRLGQLRAELAYTRSDIIVSRGLHEFIDDLQQRINTVGGAIFDSFFAMRPMTEQKPGDRHFPLSSAAAAQTQTQTQT